MPSCMKSLIGIVRQFLCPCLFTITMFVVSKFYCNTSLTITNETDFFILSFCHNNTNNITTFIKQMHSLSLTLCLQLSIYLSLPNNKTISKSVTHHIFVSGLCKGSLKHQSVFHHLHISSLSSRVFNTGRQLMTWAQTRIICSYRKFLLDIM